MINLVGTHLKKSLSALLVTFWGVGMQLIDDLLTLSYLLWPVCGNY